MAKKNQSNNNEKPHKGGDRKNDDDGTMTAVVLKMDLHCEGCAGKIAKAVRSLNGVESVKKGDNELKKIIVIGKVDPAELRQKVEEKTKKKVELISPATKKQNDAGNGEQHKEHKQQTATAKDKNKTKKFPVTTTVFKVSLDCQGCIDNVQKLVRKTEGFIDMSIEKKKDLVTVKGGIDVDMLMAALKDKLKKKIEIVRAKDGSSGGGGKKGKDEGDGKGSGGGKKGKDAEGDGKESGEDRQVEQHQYFVSQSQYIYPQYVNVPEYPYGYMHVPSMFSDENPNAACVVM